MRRILGFVSLLSMCLLAQVLMPVSGFAESASSGAGSSGLQSVPMVETTITPGYAEGEEGKVITVPKLPRKASRYLKVELRYYERLAVITGEICETTDNELKRLVESGSAYKYYTYTGFTKQREEFNQTREKLNKLLQKFSLGYGPDIEDFSGVTALFGILPRQGQRPRLEYVYSVADGACTFKLITTWYGVMK